jgi:NADH-quinone oxidoreductase subunit M
MMNLFLHPLMLVTLFPLAGFVVIAFLKPEQKTAIRWTALLASLATFGVALAILAQFQPQAGMQMVLKQDWLSFGNMAVHLEMGVDGLSLLMVLLTTFLTPLAILSTWTSVKERVKGFMLFFLLLEVGMNGVFLALDLVLFYVFWEFTLVPMYFLIGVWGGERRIYAAVKFFLFTMAGSILMLVAILYMGMTANSFSWSELVRDQAAFAGAGLWLFAAFGLAFAIKVPMFPLHTWLPDAHVEAPTAGSVILAGVLLKMGAYGFLRFNLPLFPQAAVQAAPFMAVLAVIGILYGAAVSYVQKDAKKLVAYSSVSHLGFVVLGTFSLTATGMSGAILQMVNHGLSTGALFLIVGFLYERRHTRQLDAFGGLWKVTPVLGTLALIVTLSSMGLPGLNGFSGEFPILLGSFNSPTYANTAYAGFATLGVILAAGYLLLMFEKIFLGPVGHVENRKLLDLSPREIAILVPLLLVIFWIGLYPKFFFDLLNPTVDQMAAIFKSAVAVLP